MTSTRYLVESPANWAEEDIDTLLCAAEKQVANAVQELNLRGLVIRKRRSVGLVPVARPSSQHNGGSSSGHEMTRESLDGK